MTIYLQKIFVTVTKNFVNIILLWSQNLFCKTNKAFWLYLTKYFVSNPNTHPNNGIRVTRFRQPGTRFLNWVISQFTIAHCVNIKRQFMAYRTLKTGQSCLDLPNTQPAMVKMLHQQHCQIDKCIFREYSWKIVYSHLCCSRIFMYTNSLISLSV